MYTKTINPHFESDGRRKLLTGFEGTLTDESGIVLHSMEYPSYSQAERALDALTHELLADLCERGLVDTLPQLADDDVPTDAPGDDCGDHGPYGDDDCPKCDLIVVGTRIETLAYGNGTVITITDDDQLNVQVKFDSPSRFGSKFWFDRNELRPIAPLARTRIDLAIEATMQRNRICPNCQGAHFGWQCPAIRSILFAPPRCMGCGDSLDWSGPGLCKACREWNGAEPGCLIAA